jgi:AcrR family transcriptional regulator
MEGAPMTDTRSVAIASARVLFLTRGLEATRIEDVRDASGISTGSLYHHFGSKLGLLEAVVLSALSDHKRALLEALPIDLSAQDAVRMLIATTASWISENADAARCIFRFRGALESAGSTALKTHNRNELSPLLKRLEGWIEKNEIRALPMPLLLPLLHGPLHEYARAWLAGRVDVPPSAYVEVFVASAWAALRPQ